MKNQKIWQHSHMAILDQSELRLSPLDRHALVFTKSPHFL